MAGWPNDAAVERGADALARTRSMSLDRMHDDERRRFLADARAVLEGAGKPVLVGATDAATTLGVATSNLEKVANLPEPLYRLRNGKLYDGEMVADLSMARRSARSTTTTED